MVFKPFSHLARHSFAKTFPHGYAQSLVAGAQSSYASSTTSFVPLSNHSSHRFNKPGTSQLQSAFQNTPSQTTNAKASYPSTQGSHDGGLDAYYAAWQKHQGSGEQKEWEQFQFTKRIGWKTPSVLPQGKGKEKEELGRRTDILLVREGLDRAYSTSAVDDIKKIESEIAEAAAVAKVDEAIADEIIQLQQPVDVASKQSTTTPDEQQQVAKESSTELEESGKGAAEASPLEATISSAEPSISGDNTATTSISDISDSSPYVDHIHALRNEERYAEIPPVFESMLRSNIRPTAKAYNGLLEAAIHLPLAKHQIVPKALDVYSDMLRRKVLPDTATYTILVELLSKRTVDVSKMIKSLEQSKMRFGGLQEANRFMLRSQEAEYDILTEDDALSNAIKLFDLSTAAPQERVFSASTYHLLITACATRGEVDDMIRIYSHMEAHGVIPFASVFPVMIEAFAKSGDLRSAVECYNEYKALAIADDTGKLAIIQRRDNEVYAAVVKAYAICDKFNGANRFLGKVVDSFAVLTESREERLQELQDAVTVNALVQANIDNGAFQDAFDVAEKQSLSSGSLYQAMNRICTSAADKDDSEIASRAYRYVSSNMDGSMSGAIAMLAMHIRHGNLDSARDIWSEMAATSSTNSSLTEATAMYAVALIGNGNVDEGLMQARQSFKRIRSSLDSQSDRSEATEHIDESIEFIGGFLAEKGIFPRAEASMNFMWAMIENGGLVSPVVEHLLAGLGPADIRNLSLQDLNLALQVEAGIVGSQSVLNVGHGARFADLLETAQVKGMPLDQRTSALVEKSLSVICAQHPDLIRKGQTYQIPGLRQDLQPVARTTQPNLIAAPISSYDDTFDPYAATTDYKGSTIIAEELERHGTSSGANLNEALLRFRNIRRAGRHPRYIVYARLISAAAKDGRANLVHDILGMARQDMPILSQYRIVRHGWASILDAMTGACLTLGNRTMAAQFHQELLELGTAPTANTFGLYITTLKESTKTFDEATEAMKIFHRAQLEGVEPSSFLYNALIGKLGKARRIDDCLFYFAEMRSKGIRPTSVTYGTIVNALCRVSDERFAQELFDEMESMPNYKPRPAPYNSIMQFFLTTKRDSSKVLEYYHRMQSRNIQPTMHTYKLLIDTHATLDPVNMVAAEGVLNMIRASGQRPEAIHYASLIHAKGCALHDIKGARQIFDDVLSNEGIRPQACLYQALFESMVANHGVKETKEVLEDMSANHVEMTPYIANTLIHGWAIEKDVAQSKAIYDSIGKEKREPSTYEAMTRAFLAIEARDAAQEVVQEMLSRGYPSAVSGKILELLGHGHGGSRSSSTMT